ncbi:alkene reductase [Prosthecomicrobium sp. N25]|uniref:alkene reductase n=1 Tax=Prosthecomicrobium sp. N25 TaxID=3129254 RepID=UPI003077FDD6
MTDLLFSPFRLGAIDAANRIVMAAMTRSRADNAGLVGPLTAEYYAQRASAGLILTEGLYPVATGKGYVRTPGIADAAQVAAWRRVTDAVHAAGGRIAAQIMHVGRISHRRLIGETPVAPSAIRPAGGTWTEDGVLPHETPRALTVPEIRAIVDAFADAADRAMDAGFDGVELHAGSGYLPMQFLSTGTNRRIGAYGGTLENRIRFAVEVLDAMIDRIGADRVGIKITPEMTFNDVSDDDPVATYTALVAAVARRRAAFVEIVDYGAHGLADRLRPLFGGAWLVGGGLTPAGAAGLLATGRADGAVFGEPFIANPDLPERIRLGFPLAASDKATHYAGGARGYVDYPAATARAA